MNSTQEFHASKAFRGCFITATVVLTLLLLIGVLEEENIFLLILYLLLVLGAGAGILLGLLKARNLDRRQPLMARITPGMLWLRLHDEKRFFGNRELFAIRPDGIGPFSPGRIGKHQVVLARVKPGYELPDDAPRQLIGGDTYIVVEHEEVKGNSKEFVEALNHAILLAQKRAGV